MIVLSLDCAFVSGSRGRLSSCNVLHVLLSYTGRKIHLVPRIGTSIDVHYAENERIRSFSIKMNDH